jgi:hypothetical protein
MQKYDDIPSWWFWTLLVGNISVALALVKLWPQIFQLPWWGVILGCLMSIFFTLPIGVLAATTNRVCKRLHGPFLHHLCRSNFLR